MKGLREDMNGGVLGGAVLSFPTDYKVRMLFNWTVARELRGKKWNLRTAILIETLHDFNIYSLTLDYEGTESDLLPWDKKKKKKKDSF